MTKYETTDYEDILGELAEAALAHVLRNQSEAAYQRGDLLEKRREMMSSWANYCSEAK